MVNTLGQAALENLCLQATLQEIFDLQGQHVIQSHPVLVEHTNSDETANQGVTLEKSLGILLVKLEEFTSGTSDLGENEGNSPQLPLVAETVLSRELAYRGQQRLEGTENARTFSSASRRADSKGRRGTL